MKKLLATLAIISLVSCGGNTTSDKKTDSVDTLKVDTTLKTDTIGEK